MARVFGTSHASLYRWFAASDLPPLGQIIDWIRLCHAAHFLARGWNVEAVAAELSYGSSSVFRLALKRYTDLRSSSLRGEEGFDKVFAPFTIALQMARSAHPNRDRQSTREQALATV